MSSHMVELSVEQGVATLTLTDVSRKTVLVNEDAKLAAIYRRLMRMAGEAVECWKGRNGVSVRCDTGNAETPPRSSLRQADMRRTDRPPVWHDLISSASTCLLTWSPLSPD